MHKKFYASGFLYHLPTQQILLQQDTTSENFSNQWFLFGGRYTEKELPEDVFKKIIANLLQIRIDLVHAVYSYETDDASQHIVYSEIDELIEFSSQNGLLFNWFPFKNMHKMQISEQTKHDIIVGQRVIEASGRKSRGEHTFQ